MSLRLSLFLILAVATWAITVNPEHKMESGGDVWKTQVYGLADGIPFDWKDENAENLEEITGNVGWLIDAIQLHFSNTQSARIGGYGGGGHYIYLPKKVDQVIVRSDSERLYTVDFLAVGMRERFGS